MRSCWRVAVSTPSCTPYRPPRTRERYHGVPEGRAMNGFRKFILRGNVIDLAVAVVIGASFAAVVTALTKDIITPIIGIFGGIPDFSAVSFSVNNSRFLIGDFINAVLAFVIMAVIIYFLIVLPIN